MNNIESVTTPPNSEERLMAALSHVTIILSVMGVVAPIIIWATQKDKSRYVAFQALQAVVYQVAMVFGWFIFMGCYMASIFASFGGLLLLPGLDSTPVGVGLMMLPMIVPMVVMVGMVVCWIASVVYGLVGAVQVFRGKPFRYVLLGKRIERYLSQN